MIRIGTKLDANSRNINFDYQGNIVKKKPVNMERLPHVFENVGFKVKRPDELNDTNYSQMSDTAQQKVIEEKKKEEELKKKLKRGGSTKKLQPKK